ncbi:hypothetical protein QOZ80_3AG0224390 [Eleusine coracana subsp. coracana]|nr:hypothetical protein QOZ80_3AG0224390 [Eleusine coracana subsp. coracana]
MDHPGWCIAERFFILTYDVRAAEAGAIELPPAAANLPDGCTVSNLHLASSPDAKLSLLVADKLRISVWLLLPDGAGWSRHAVINTRATVKSLLPHDTPPEWWLAKVIEFGGSFSGARSGAILVRPFDKELNDQPQEDGEGLVVLDLETKEMRRAKRDRRVQAFPFEIDLKSRLSTMKTF